jgi:predicted ATP-dependent Lon-type protease
MLAYRLLSVLQWKLKEASGKEDSWESADTRDTNAITKLCDGYLKLLFPHVKDIKDINKRDFEEYCLKPAKKIRSIIRKQIELCTVCLCTIINRCVSGECAQDSDSHALK